MDYGLIGEKLPHSFSKEIHELIGDYKYSLKELKPDELENFILSKNFKFHDHDKVSIAPRYLKFVKSEYDDGYEYFTLGWCNISIAE